MNLKIQCKSDFWSGTEIFLFTVKYNVKFEKSEKFRIPSFHSYKTMSILKLKFILKINIFKVYIGIFKASEEIGLVG